MITEGGIKSSFEFFRSFKTAYLLVYFWLCWVFIAACGLSLVAVHGLLSVVASLIVEHRLECSGTQGLPRPGIRPASPALAGRFSVTGPPEKSPRPKFLRKWSGLLFYYFFIREFFKNNNIYWHESAVDLHVWLLKITFESVNCLVLSDSLLPCGLWPARLISPWDSPGKNTGVGSHSLLQGIFPSQEMNPGILNCKWILYHLSHQGSPLSNYKSATCITTF